MRGLKLLAVGVGLAAGLATASSAGARDAASDDVQCLAVSLTLAGMADPEVAQAGMMSTFYFAGKVEGRNPDADAMDMAARALKMMSPEEVQTAAQRCGAVLMEKGKAWIEKGKALEAEGL